MTNISAPKAQTGFISFRERKKRFILSVDFLMHNYCLGNELNLGTNLLFDFRHL